MPTKLESRFRLTYYMILNLLRVKQLTVEDMMKRSFAEYYQQKDAPENEKKLEELQRKVTSLKDPDCQMCSVDLKQYYTTWAELLQRKKDLKVIDSTEVIISSYYLHAGLVQSTSYYFKLNCGQTLFT